MWFNLQERMFVRELSSAYRGLGITQRIPKIRGLGYDPSVARWTLTDLLGSHHPTERWVRQRRCRGRWTQLTDLLRGLIIHAAEMWERWRRCRVRLTQLTDLLGGLMIQPSGESDDAGVRVDAKEASIIAPTQVVRHSPPCYTILKMGHRKLVTGSTKLVTDNTKLINGPHDAAYKRT